VRMSCRRQGQIDVMTAITDAFAARLLRMRASGTHSSQKHFAVANSGADAALNRPCW